MSNLYLVRHGLSTFNEQNLFTGWVDVPLSEQGKIEAKMTGKKLKDRPFSIAYTSNLIRAYQTLDIILKETGKEDIRVIKNEAINERNYGDLQGLNKDEVAAKVGKKKVHEWRRSYTSRPPGGESLEDTANRVAPYFNDHILSDVMNGLDVLVVAHGNSLRAIVKLLDHLDDTEITNLEIPTGEIICYSINSKGEVLSKNIL